MTRTLESISSLLHEAGETHHRVFRIVDGADADWASWYADWLVNLSELPDVLGLKPVTAVIQLSLRDPPRRRSRRFMQVEPVVPVCRFFPLRGAELVLTCA
jgi:hypothetical protein